MDSSTSSACRATPLITIPGCKNNLAKAHRHKQPQRGSSYYVPPLVVSCFTVICVIALTTCSCTAAYTSVQQQPTSSRRDVARVGKLLPMQAESTRPTRGHRSPLPLQRLLVFPKKNKSKSTLTSMTRSSTILLFTSVSKKETTFTTPSRQHGSTIYQ